MHLLNQSRCSFVIVLILSVVSLLVVVEGQQTQQSSPQAKVPQLPIRTTTQSTAEEEDEESESEARAAPALTINPDDRQRLRLSLQDMLKRRRVTARASTMSPDVLSTTNVYNFFSKQRFTRKRNVTKTTPESTIGV